MDVFKDEFVPNIEGQSQHAKWVRANPGENAKWKAYRDACIAHKKDQPDPVPPVLASKYGKALVAAGKLDVSVTDLGSDWGTPPDPPPVGGTWEAAVAAALPRPAFTPTRTINCSNQSQLDSAVANLQAGDLVQCVGTWGYSGSMTIQKQLANFAEIHFDNMTFTLPGLHNSGQCVWVNNCNKIRMYGGHVIRSGGFGFRIYGGTDIRWQDFTIDNCDASGLHLNTGAGAGSNMVRPVFKGEISNTGLYDAPAGQPGSSGHAEPGTGWHGCYIGSGDGVFSMSNGKIALDIHDQPSGAGVEVNECNSTEFWVRAKRLTFNAQQQTAGNAVQGWGATQSNNTYHWIEADTITGHAYVTISGLSNCVVEYGRAVNFSTNPNSANFAWGTSGGMIYQDVQPQSFGAGD